ncbi:hypothetical protein PRIEUP_LOCUS1401 [Pristimantis euphronides]
MKPKPVSVRGTTASSTLLPASQSPARDAGADAARPAAGLAPLRALSASRSSSLSQRSIQLYLSQALERKRKYAATHPQAQVLNRHIYKLLALEMLPFRLVDTEAFRSIMAAAVPWYSVPRRHYFSSCAVPTLYQHVSQKLSRALNNAVTGKVHFDDRHVDQCLWTGTLHFPDGTLGQRCGGWYRVGPWDGTHTTNAKDCRPQLHQGFVYLLHQFRHLLFHLPIVSSEYSILTSCKMEALQHCSTALGKWQQAPLKLICLGDKQHTTAELWRGISDQTDRWLLPLNLKPGMVMCDSGRNLVAALELGKHKHVPCLAHVLNLVVQRFLKTYPGLRELLLKYATCAPISTSHLLLPPVCQCCSSTSKCQLTDWCVTFPHAGTPP